MRSWQERDHGLRRRIEELEAQLVEARKLDESRIASVLGEETARIISAAREAAAEIRSKASEDAERLVREAEESSRATANALTTEAEALRTEAESMREEAAREYTTKVDEARTRHDELIASAESKRDELVSEAQARHDELLAEAQNRHDELLAEAQARHDELISDAETRNTELVTAAEQVLAERTAEANSEADAILDDARSKGRAMVAEAKEVRDRILADLAERRRIARRQIEGAVAGRDSVVEVLQAAGASLAAIVTDLRDADKVARDHANHVAEVLPDDSAEFLAGLGATDPVVSVDGEDGSPTTPDGAEPEEIPDDASGIAPEHDTEPLEATEVADDVEAVTGPVASAPPEAVAGTDDVGSSGPEPSEGGEPVGSSGDADGGVLVPDEVVPGSTRGDGDVDGAGEDTETGHEVVAAADTAGPDDASPVDTTTDGDASSGSSGDATVHDLFAKIRAQGIDGGDSDDDLEDGDDLYDDVDLDDSDDVDGDREEHDGVVIDLASVDNGAVDQLSRVAEFLDARDELLVPVERQLLRTLRRLASDEQNEVLDRLRRIKRGRPDMDDVIPSAEEMMTTFSDGTIADFSAAVRAGFDFWVNAGGTTEMATFVVPADVRERLSDVVSGFISVHRAHLERAMDQAEEAGSGADELAAAIKSVYRDWRQSALTEMAGDLAIAGFSHGERTAAGPGVPWLWVVDNGGLPCADGEDNALAGPVLSDEAFPTGDLAPPAHSGCRCILVPADQ